MKYVYFIQQEATGVIKIGTADEPSKRLSELQTASAYRLTLIAVTPGGVELEKRLHNTFADDRLLGEWFTPSDQLTSYIGRIQNSEDVCIARDASVDVIANQLLSTFGEEKVALLVRMLAPYVDSSVRPRVEDKDEDIILKKLNAIQLKVYTRLQADGELSYQKISSLSKNWRVGKSPGRIPKRGIQLLFKKLCDLKLAEVVESDRKGLPAKIAPNSQ